MDLLSQQPTFSNDPETKDFDLSAGNRWIYPENYPIRNYQYAIVETALFNNTLICLPTGLGKTFIAAVVMYNYWRWYPHGIIVFLAPTKPLVTQQIDACHNIMGIPISDTIELTGKINPQQRKLIWRKKRVIFATPQTFQKDLETNIVPCELIKCVVVDEAHKATGKHSYSESIKLLNNNNPYFRIIGLSATPGSKLESVQQVIKNLKITHLELRDDTSSDIKPYINERKTDIILVGLGNDLINFKEKYINIMDRHVKILLNNNVIRNATSNISKGQMFLLMQQCQANKNKYRNYGTIIKTLTILTTMAHAYEVIIRHGLRSFYNFYKSHMNDSKKSWLKEEIELSNLIDEIGNYIGPFPDVNNLINNTDNNIDIPNNIIFGHGKFEKLKELLLIHFNNANNNNINTRAMVFVETRDIANEIYVLLLTMKPLVRPQIFVGQAGLKQKAQTKAVDDFRNDIVNVLVSTSVGEEGLDFGEVDLIICFEISQINPTRLVQRMGRTGRKRDGHIIVLVTDGKEHQTLKASINKRDGLNQKVLKSDIVASSLLSSSPRMIPKSINPQCLKMNITIIPKQKPTKTIKNNKNKKTTVKKINKKTTIAECNVVVVDPVVDNNYNDNNDEQVIIDDLNLPSTSDNVKNNNKNTKICQFGTMTKFLKTNIHNDDSIIPMKKIQTKKNCINNIIKPFNVKLLTSDKHSNDFLTLCAIKNSENELKINNNNNKISYLPKSISFDDFEDDDLFNNYELSNDDIIKCLKTLEKFIKYNDDDDDDIITPVTSKNHVDDINLNLQTKKTSDSHDENILSNEFKIDDLFNASDSDLTYYESGGESPPKECVDWINNNSNDNLLKNFDKNISSNSFILSPSEPIIEKGFQDILNDTTDDEKAKEVEETPDYLEQFDKMELEPNSSNPINNNDVFDDDKRIYSQQQPTLNDDDDDDDDNDDDTNIEKGFLSILDQSSSNSLDDISDNNNKNNSKNKKQQNDIEQVVHLEENKINSINNINNLVVSETELMDTDIFFDDDDDEIVESSPPKISKSQLFKEKTFKNYEKSSIINENLTNKSQLNILKSQNNNDKKNFSNFATLVINNNNNNNKDDDDDEVVEKTPPKPKQKSLSQRINHSRRIMNKTSFSKSQSASNFTFNNNVKQNSFNFPSFDFSRFQIDNKVSIEKNKNIIEADTVVLNTTNFNAQKITSNKQSTDKNNLIDNNSQETKFYTPPETLSDTVKLMDDDLDINFSALHCHSILNNKINSEADTSIVDTDNNINSINNKLSTKTIEIVDMLNDSNDEDTYFSPHKNNSEKLTNNKNKLPSISESDIITQTQNHLKKNKLNSSLQSVVNENSLRPFEFNKSIEIPSDNAILIPEDEEINFSTWNTSTPEKSNISRLNSFSKSQKKSQEIQLKMFSKDNDTTNNNKKNLEQIEIIDEFFDSDFEIDPEIINDNNINNKVSVQENKLLKNSTETSQKNKPIEYEFNADDYDWGSDFETSFDPIIESKHFKTTNFSDKITNNEKELIKNTSNLDNQLKTKNNKPIDLNSFNYKNKKSSIIVTNKLQPINKKPLSKDQLIYDDNSDDDFAPSKIQKCVFTGNSSNFINIHNNKSPIPGTSKIINNNNSNNNEDDDDDDDDNDWIDSKKSKITTNKLEFNNFAVPKKYESKKIKNKESCNNLLKLKKKRKNKLKSNFIDDEAQVSSGENDETSDEEDEDGDLDGFVSYSQHVDEETDMKAHYLQSIKSPKGARGRFIIKQPKSPIPDIQIYSQAIQEPDNYQYDSFCVRESDIEDDDNSNDEIIEDYNKISRKKKRKREESNSRQSKKKKRIVSVVSDNSSDDEIEKMRFAIVEESKRLNHS